ncbi:MAG: hypothetical protein HC815_05900 [Richelia sp. RM1_1_1]|nr:hypothetical protein [Richelia sp. RM1_1_1]
MKSYLLKSVLLLSLTTPFIPKQAQANIIRPIEAEQASGLNATKQTIKVWAGHGVSISFYTSGEIIKKIWLDDPSRFVIDVDGCLEGMKGCSGDNVGAGLIHLRKIDPVKIPGLPQAGTWGSHLTVVTESNAKKKVYHFSIVPGSGTPEYSQIEIIASQRENIASKQPQSLSQSVDYTAVSDSKYIAKGMEIAVSNQWLATNTKLWDRLNKLIALRSQGTDLTLAASDAGVSMKLVKKLMQMGGKRYIEMPPPQPNEVPTPANVGFEKKVIKNYE